MRARHDAALARLDFEATVESLDLGKVSFQDIAEHVSDRADCALLESQGGHGTLSEYSFLCFAPFGRVTVNGSGTTVRLGRQVYESRQHPFAVLEEVLATCRVSEPAGGRTLPFVGGAVGFLGYELGRHLETLPYTAVHDTGLPDAYLALYNFTIAEHRESGALFLAWLDAGGESVGPGREDVLAELARVPAGLAVHRSNARLSAAPCGTPSAGHARANGTSPTLSVTPDMSRDEYLDAVRRIKAYIRAGDVYQVNMTQRFRAATGDMRAWDLYRHLADTNPAPFAAYLNHEDHAIVSSSPERFLRVRGRHVETRPIKGTSRRGTSTDEDATRRTQLVESPKNRAELAMIVDLLRNDLGRVCTPGSVRVQAYPEVETYPSVHHLVATIAGELEDGRTPVDLLRAAFPGGSITGCPKIRAMEIIDELEPTTRGVYTGSIGYLGFDGSADLNIAIRTAIVSDGTTYIHAGGGVIDDSDEHEEYEESLLKAGKLIEAVRTVGA